MRAANSSVDTVNAAAVAVATSFERRVQQDTVPRRRWTAWFSDFWCFGSPKTDGHIRYATLAPEPARPTLDAPELENSNHQLSPSLPFVVPPSSPASFLQSGPPSSTLSPTGPLSFSTISASSYSPSGTTSIFAIGPYAHETQLVSPPVFSTFTTEPSTAPFTPPPESAHLTTPSSPEVPFANFLTSSLNGNYKNDAYEFQSYQFYPGSPIGNLISPSSVCSGTSSPFRDAEFLSSGVTLSFPTSEPPKILSAEGIAERKLTLEHARNGKSLLDGQISAVVPFTGSTISSQSNGSVAASDQRGSFELNAEEFTCCLGIKPSLPGEGISEFPVSRNSGTQQSNESDVTYGISINEAYHDLPRKIQQPVAITSAKEFKFDNSDGASGDASVGSDWWANEKVVVTATEHQKSWPFFPMIQPERGKVSCFFPPSSWQPKNIFRFWMNVDTMEMLFSCNSSILEEAIKSLNRKKSDSIHAFNPLTDVKPNDIAEHLRRPTPPMLTACLPSWRWSPAPVTPDVLLGRPFMWSLPRDGRELLK